MKRSLLINSGTACQITRQLTMLRREIERLHIRLLSMQRYQRQIVSDDEALDEEDSEVYEELSSSIEALISDMSTYKQQLEDQHSHISQGLSTYLALEPGPITQTFAQYIYDDVRMLVLHAQTAREGYNELIENVVDSIELKD